MTSSSGGGAHLPPSVVRDSGGVSAPLVDVAGNQLVNVPAWQATTLYPAGYVVQQNGLLWAANATFTSGGSFVASNWTALTVAGVELSSCSSTTQQTGIGAITDLTGMTFPGFVAPSRPVLLETWIPCSTVTSNEVVTVTVRDTSNVVVAIAFRTLTVNFFEIMYLRSRVSTLTPGTTYNWKVSLTSSTGGGGSVTTQGAATAPMLAQVTTL